MRRIVITGATGAIGMAMIGLCIRKGVEALILCRKDSARAGRIPVHPLIRVRYCDLSQMRDWKPEEQESYDIFYHFAWAGTTGTARNDMYLQNKNVEYTLDAIRLAGHLGCHTFIGAGSQAEYGRVEGKLNENTPVRPENGYGIAKLCAGLMSREECRSLGMRHIWTRILSVYGPYDGENSVIMSSIQKLLRGEEPELTAGDQIWDYLYSEDAARAFLALGEKGRDGAVYCIGSGEARPLKEYLYLLRDAVDPALPLGLGKRPYGGKQIMYLSADISRLKEDTGFAPEVSFEDGIRRTVEWGKSFFNSPKVSGRR